MSDCFSEESVGCLGRSSVSRSHSCSCRHLEAQLGLECPRYGFIHSFIHCQWLLTVTFFSSTFPFHILAWDSSQYDYQIPIRSIPRGQTPMWGERERERNTYFRVLGHWIMRLPTPKSVGWASKLETQGKANISAPIQRPSAGRIPSCSEEVSLFYIQP